MNWRGLQDIAWGLAIGSLSAIWGMRPGLFASILIRRKHMKDLFLRLWKDESGQDLTEYALLLVFIALAAISAMGTLATAINAVYTTAAKNLATT